MRKKRHFNLAALFRVVLILLTVIAVVLLAVLQSPLSGDTVFLAAGIVTSILALSLRPVSRKTVYVQVPAPPVSPVDQTADPISTDSQPSQSTPDNQDDNVVEAVPETVPETAPVTAPGPIPAQNPDPASGMDDVIVGQLCGIRDRFCDPFKKVVESLDPEHMTDEQRKTILSDLHQIAFLYMDYTNLTTRPGSSAKMKMMEDLISGSLTVAEALENAKDVTDYAFDTPKFYRHLQKILASDGNEYFFSGYRL